jgi:hypothetical protein
MPYLGQAQVGTLKSTPKLTKINGDDDLALIYRNLGNNHAYPFVFAVNVALTSGTDFVVASGIEWHGFKLAASSFITATPDADPGGHIYVDKDTDNNVITVKSTGGNSVGVDVMFMVGNEPDIANIHCRGNTGAAQSLP